MGPGGEDAGVGNQDSWVRKVGLALFGRIFVQSYPFEELFFLEEARAIRQAVELPLVLLGGICSQGNLTEALNQGFDFVALGRALIRNPNFVHDLQSGVVDSSDCDHCNRCIAEMDRGGVRCVCPPS